MTPRVLQSLPHRAEWCSHALHKKDVFVIFDFFKRKKKTAPPTVAADKAEKAPEEAAPAVAEKPTGKPTEKSVAKPVAKKEAGAPSKTVSAPSKSSSAPAKTAAKKPAGTSTPAAKKPAASATKSGPAKSGTASAPAKAEGNASASVAELREQAKKLGIPGVSRLTKPELQRAIASHK